MFLIPRNKTAAVIETKSTAESTASWHGVRRTRKAFELSNACVHSLVNQSIKRLHAGYYAHCNCSKESHLSYRTNLETRIFWLQRLFNKGKSKLAFLDFKQMWQYSWKFRRARSNLGNISLHATCHMTYGSCYYRFPLFSLTVHVLCCRLYLHRLRVVSLSLCLLSNTVNKPRGKNGRVKSSRASHP